VRGVLILTLQQPFGSGQPAPHRCHQGGIEKQVHRDVNRRPRRRALITGLHTGRVRTLPRLNRHIEVPRRVGHLAKNR
jgi:hypothetical protein